jgi:hypothetical protein
MSGHSGSRRSESEAAMKSVRHNAPSDGSNERTFIMAGAKEMQP